MHLKRMVIKNFRSHKATVINFEPHINALTGPSGAGKSSVLRALQWAIFNEPKGTEFITWGEDHCYVKLLFADGLKVTRYRSKSENYYSVRWPDGKKERFTNLPPTGLPAPLQEALNLGPVNVRWQHDGPFLLSDSPSEVSQKFSAIVQAELAEDLIKILNKRIWSYQSEIKALEEQIDKARKALTKKETARTVLEKAERAEELRTEILNLKSRKLKILVLTKEVRELTKILVKKGVLARIEEMMKTAESLSYSIDTKEKYVVSIKKTLTDAKALLLLIEELKEQIAEAEAEFRENFPDLCPLCGQKVRKGR